MHVTGSGTNSLNCLQRTAAHEDGEPPEEPLLLLAEQLIAPLDRVAQRLLSRRQIARASGQHLQPLRKAFEQRLGRK
jgi:hypothetical protein